jgi:8-oxo-dGTP pyrophosphatase MutT (NUDIX family)
MIRRTTARVLLLDPDGRLMLFRGVDPARPEAGHWWFTPGGGVEPGETLTEAARREIREETGHVLPDDLGPVIHQQTIRFTFDGTEYEQVDNFFRATAEHTRVDYSGWTEIERRAVHLHRWWTLEELATTTETLHPADVLTILTAIDE